MFQWLTTSQAGHLLLTLLISAVPVIELRGGIPYGIAQGANPWLVFAASVIGNMLPVPFILLFIRKILRWMKRYPRLGRIANKLESRAARKSAGVRKSELIGLCILVALPLPGTGAWTGTLAASLLDMDFKKSVLACMGGVLLAGIIMGLASAGLLGALSTLFSVG